MIPINEYMTLQPDLPPYLPYPRFLSEMNLTLTAKLVYSLLLDRTTLSQKNGWTKPGISMWFSRSTRCPKAWAAAP